MNDCPCMSGQDYSSCCEPIHKAIKRADSAEALMRARYSAFAKVEIEFLGASLHPSKREDHNPDSTREWAVQSDWKDLKILRTEGGLGIDRDGTVEFVATYSTQGEDLAHHEIATFRQEDGQWFFWDGKVQSGEPFTREEPKLGRNDPCHCGSGKKFKKCCFSK